MGRYYNGDIDGKFWFGVQCSTAPEKFGCQEITPSHIQYYIDDESIEKVEEELNVIRNIMGEQLNKYQEYFTANDSYSDAILLQNNIDKRFIGDYADYVLGMKILNCIKENGSCEFYAEI